MEPSCIRGDGLNGRNVHEKSEATIKKEAEIMQGERISGNRNVKLNRATGISLIMPIKSRSCCLRFQQRLPNAVENDRKRSGKWKT